jgi:signal transduction histidine kinase
MKYITLKIIVSLVCCSLIIALILSGSAVTQSKDVMQAEVIKELLYASQKYANQFSTEIEIQENVVDLICTMVSANFTVEEYRKDRSRFLSLEKKLDEMIRDTMENIPETQSLYLTFNPETSGANDEIWYLRNENEKVYYMEADNTASDWLVDDGSVDSAYYFEAVRKGRSWSGVEYDKYLDIYSVTYSRACLDKNVELIGVMGTDIFIDHIFYTVKNIQLEEGGYAFLTDSSFHYLAGSMPEEFFNKMKKEGILELAEADTADGQGKVPADVISYSNADGEHYLSTYAEISNGWILTLVQNEKTLLQPIRDMKRILFTMAGLILIGVLAYSYYFFKKSLVPIVKEFEQKDIIMLHQSRQAKLGEMVGNIAHQWKQPLNVMSITLSNLCDDFRHGNLTEEQLKAHIDDMRLYIKNMSSTVDDFADFLKPSRKKEEFSLNDAVETALGLMQESVKINRITVMKEAEENLTAYGYRNEFCQGIFNILNNARDAIIEAEPGKREIRINIYSLKVLKHKAVSVIDITNNGAQIPEASLPLLFEPYFTTKEEKGGTGIGLYLTKEIVEAHMNGTIRLFNVENGVCCRIMIPNELPKGIAKEAVE